jgi:hypothetical protein
MTSGGERRVSGRALRWYDGVAPATALVSCGGRQHPIVWRRGRISAPAHDLAAESALVALGAAPCPCLEVAAACRNGLSVEDVFLLWTEQADPTVGTSQALERWARRVGWARPALSGPPAPRSPRSRSPSTSTSMAAASAAAASAPAGPVPGTTAARRAEERRSALLASLPLALRRRLALGVFRAIGREPVPDLSTSHPGFVPIFASLLTEAARSAGSIGPVPGEGRGPGVRWQAGPDAAGARVERRGRALFVTVSPGWVADVWAWGAAAVDGWLILEVVRRRSLDRLLVRGLPPGEEVAALRYAPIRRDGGAWRVEQVAGSSCARSRRASTTAFPSQSLLK